MSFFEKKLFAIWFFGGYGVKKSNGELRYESPSSSYTASQESGRCASFRHQVGSPGGIPRRPCHLSNSSFPPGRFCASSFTFLLDHCDTRTNVDKKTNREVATFPGKPIQLVSCLLEFISVAGVCTARAPRLFVTKSAIGNHSRYRYLHKLSGDLNSALSPFKRATPSLGACQKYLGQACRVAYAPPATEACFLQSGED
jgi:hypothetical protein